MAINPDNITTIRVDQLSEDTLNLTNEFAHANGTELKKATIQALVDLVATAIGAGSGVGYLPISVTDGQQLPDVPTDPGFFLAGIGTYLNVNGYPDIICTEELNAIMNVVDHWEIAVEIPIEPLSGSVQSVTGSAVDNTDPLNPIVDLPTVATPTLQEVTDVGNTITDIDGSETSLIAGGIDLVDGITGDFAGLSGGAISCSKTNGKGTEISPENGLSLKQTTSNASSHIKASNVTTHRSLEVPDASGTIALTSDISTPTFQEVTDENNETTLPIKVAELQLYKPTDDNYLGISADADEVLFTNYANGLKSFIFDVSEFTSGHNYILPDASGTIALISDIPVVDATPTDGSTNAVSSNGVFDALALKTDKSRTIYQDATSVTGVATQTLLATMKIDANTYASDDAFSFKMSIQKGVTASTVEYKLWLGTTSGALTSQIGRSIMNAATRGCDFYRDFYINSGNLDTAVGFNTNATTGISQGTVANTPVAVTMSNDLWISITVTPTNTSDVNGIMGASITPLK